MKKLLLLIPSLLLASCGSTPLPQTFKVVVEQNDSFLLTGSNVVEVNEGETASFEITMNRGYQFDSINHGEYEDGHIILKDVHASTRIIVSYIKIPEYTISLENDSTKGIVSGLPHQTVLDGEIIELSVETFEGYFFSGWSLNDTINNGGTLLSMDETFIYQPKEDMHIYANYLNEDEGDFITYDLNGGKMINGNPKTSFLELIPTYLDIVKNPNTSIGTNKIYKDGYTLYSWNTKNDGTGIDIGLGSRLSPKNGKNLYAKWVKWTNSEDFNFEIISGNEITITKYLGNDELVVIPERIGNYTVSGISKNAFINKNLDEIVFSQTIKTVENSAFVNCSQLNHIKLFDNIDTIHDAAFSGLCPIETLSINAKRNPAFTDSGVASIANNLDYIDSIEGKRMIFFGGSNVYYNIDTETAIANSHDYSHGIVASIAETGYRLHSELALSIAKEDDIILGSPIYAESGFGTDDELYVESYRYLESNFDLLKIINISQYSSVFDNLTKFNELRKHLPSKRYIDYYHDRDKYGYYFPERGGRTPEWTRFSVTFSENLFSDSIKEFYADFYNRCNDKNVTFYTIPTPFDNVGMHYDCAKETFDAHYREVFPTTIWNIEEFALPGNYFYDTEYHFSSAAAADYTQKAFDIIWEEITKS